MATSFDADNVLSHTRWSQIVFLTIAVVFNLCLVAQVLSVGLAFFYSPICAIASVFMVAVSHACLLYIRRRIKLQLHLIHTSSEDRNNQSFEMKHLLQLPVKR